MHSESDNGAVRVVRGCHRETDGTVRLELAGELDLSTSDQVVTALRTILATPPPGVVLDATAVTFIDSTGIGTLLASRRDCRNVGSRFSVTTSPGVEKVTRLLGVHEVLVSGSDDPDPVSS